MASRRHLDHAPIKEALIDIRGTPAGVFEFNLDNDIYKEVMRGYPKKEEISFNQIGIQINQNKPVQTITQQAPYGYRFTSSDDKQIVQFKKDGFTFSRLEPYKTWEQMRDSAKILWNLYSSINPLQVVSRVATRYINVIKLPLPFSDFDEYLTASPQIPSTLPQSVSGFFTRTIINEPQQGISCIITQAMEGQDKEHLSITLDIDVIKIEQFAPDSDQIWYTLENIREFKNKVFFEYVTEKCLELFQ